jgi:hypothetical protein
LAADSPGGRQLIDVRTYHFANAQKQRAYEQFLGQAGIAALNRAGVEPVGVWKLAAKDNPNLKLTADPTDLYVVLPHKSMDSVLTLERRLAADEEYQKAGEKVLKTAKSDPAYSRYESSLLLAFEGFPQVQAPTKAPTRLIQLRIYESHNEERARKKIHMFDVGGETAIFKKVGLNPVFFGEAIAGAKLPNLTYAVAFENEAAMKAGWDAFRVDPDWKKLAADQTYKDTVSTITNLVLRPAEGSQI